jgi:predicted aspartyl protease
MSILKQYIDMNTHEINSLLSAKYPQIKIEELDEESINDIVASLITEELATNPNGSLSNKLNESYNQDEQEEQEEDENDIIVQNKRMAFENIPEVMIPATHIMLDGNINNVPLKILIDTGATTNLTWKNVINNVGLDYLVDKKTTYKISGIESSNTTYGKIWYTEINLNLFDKETAQIGVDLDVANSDAENKSRDIILGMGFLKSYGANIDLKNNILTLNDKIKIKFSTEHKF